MPSPIPAILLVVTAAPYSPTREGSRARSLPERVASPDPFAQRRPEVASRMQVFEVDQPRPQAWKRLRLAELGHDIPDRLHLVPVDFERHEDLLRKLVAAGFDPGRPAIVVSTDVTMYLTEEATAATLRQTANSPPARCSR